MDPSKEDIYKMSINPKLSICIPTYNRAEYLAETLQSIIMQATDEIEIVISDNASSDDTAAIVAKFRENFPSITYFKHLENVGADRNYLQVVELAKGDYCWLFGSDDVMKEHAITRILNEIKSGADVYLCGLTLCTLDMVPIERHKILNVDSDQRFNLGNVSERNIYFELAETTTAFFSFLGSLIVNKKKWDQAAIDEELFYGSLWSHVAKIFGMLPDGLIVYYIHKSLINKRGDNDSFLGDGMVRRYEVAINGYRKIANKFFGEDSTEAFHIRRTVRRELTLKHLLNAKFECMDRRSIKEILFLDRLVTVHYSDPGIGNLFKSMLYKLTPMFIYRHIKLSKRVLKKLLVND